MSTIASPRPSLSAAAPSSSRSSIDTGSRSSSRAPGPNQRRNRAALRDYYGLQKASPPPPASSSTPENDDEVGVNESPDAEELDRPGFSADHYVAALLQREGLQRVLRVESGLVGDIRGLDGERKALVYDNYSKLIAATETIRKMKNNMDPLGPTSLTLGPTIAHIADTSATLIQRMSEKVPVAVNTEVQEQEDIKSKQVQTVRWVVETPQRILMQLAEGKRPAAQDDYAEVSRLLDKWKDVRGVDDIRSQCEAILNERVDDTVS